MLKIESRSCLLKYCDRRKNYANPTDKPKICSKKAVLPTKFVSMDTNKSSMKSVSFLIENEVHLVESVTAYSNAERHNTWYSRDEIKKIQETAAKLMTHQEMLTAYLAYYSSCVMNENQDFRFCRMYDYTTKQRKNIVQKVLRIQKQGSKQWQTKIGRSVEESLKSKYSALTKFQRNRARDFGRSDARDAAQIYIKDRILLSPLSNKNRKTTSETLVKRNIIPCRKRSQTYLKRLCN